MVFLLENCSLFPSHGTRIENLPRAAGFKEKDRSTQETLICCHLYSVWKAVDRILTSEPEGHSIEISPADKEATRKALEDKHCCVYTQWQTPDVNTLGWLIRNVERKKYVVNDLTRVNSQTPEPCDPTHVGGSHPKGKQILANHNGQAVWVPADDKKMEDINFKAWARRLQLYLVGEHIAGFKLYPDGSWVSLKEINIYWSHVGQHVLHAPPSMQMPFKSAQRADLSIRGKWMEYLREGKKLGEAIQLTAQFMHVKMNYVVAPTPAPTQPSSSGLSKSAIETLVRAELNKKQNSSNQRQHNNNNNSRDSRNNNRNGNNDRGGKRTTNKKIQKKEACRLFNSAEGCKRKECRFDHFCTKCKKKSCTKGAANCTH